MSFVDNGMAGLSERLEKTLLRLPGGYYLLGLGPYNAGLVRLDFDELLIGREVPEFIGVGMPVSGFRVSSPDAFPNTEVSRLHAKLFRLPLSSGGLPRRHHRLVRRGRRPRAMGPAVALDRHGTDVDRAAAASRVLRHRRHGLRWRSGRRRFPLTRPPAARRFLAGARTVSRRRARGHCGSRNRSRDARAFRRPGAFAAFSLD